MGSSPRGGSTPELVRSHRTLSISISFAARGDACSEGLSGWKSRHGGAHRHWSSGALSLALPPFLLLWLSPLLLLPCFSSCWIFPLGCCCFLGVSCCWPPFPARPPPAEGLLDSLDWKRFRARDFADCCIVEESTWVQYRLHLSLFSSEAPMPSKWGLNWEDMMFRA